jgi:hypothetical protein
VSADGRKGENRERVGEREKERERLVPGMGKVGSSSFETPGSERGGGRGAGVSGGFSSSSGKWTQGKDNRLRVRVRIRLRVRVRVGVSCCIGIIIIILSLLLLL